MGQAVVGAIGVTPEALRQTTAPALLCALARDCAARVAFRSKHRGLYRERTWRDYALLVAQTAKAFAGLGLQPGERVAIMGESCEEWVICDLAAQSLGAIVYGIYPTASAAEVEYQMRDGGAVLFVAEDQEYADKILPLAERLPDLRHVVVVDDSAMSGYDHAKLKSYRALRADVEADLDWLEPLLGTLADNADLLVKGDDNTLMNRLAIAVNGDGADREARPETADPTRKKAPGQSHIRAARPKTPPAKV